MKFGIDIDMELYNFFVLIFDFLNESYIRLKEEWNHIYASEIDTPSDEYKKVIINFLVEKELIEPVNDDYGGVVITGKGIEYLFTNPMMQKVAETMQKTVGLR